MSKEKTSSNEKAPVREEITAKITWVLKTPINTLATNIHGGPHASDNTVQFASSSSAQGSRFAVLGEKTVSTLVIDSSNSKPTSTDVSHSTTNFNQYHVTLIPN